MCVCVFIYLFFYVFTTCARVPGGLGGRSRGAWAASPGLLGRIPGAPRGGSRPQTTRPKVTPRPFKFASKFMSILMSIFGRFGVDLGSLLGVMFGHVGAFFGPSWSRNRLRTVLSSKKRLFTKPFKTNGFRRFFAPRWRPKTTEDRSKTGPASSWIVFFALNFRFDF